MSVTKDRLRKILIHIGLDEGESDVYLAALKLGQSTAAELSKETNIKRSTVYTIIERLMGRGLMGEIYRGLKRKFVAESPQKLEELLQERHKTFHEYLPDFMNLHSHTSTDHNVKVFEGVEGLKNGLTACISDLMPGDDYYVIANIEGIIELIPEHFYSFAKKRAQHDINLKTILQDGPKTREYVNWAQNTIEQIKIIPADSPFMSNIVVTSHRVMMPHMKPFTGAIIIENSQAIATQQQVFMMMWNMLSDQIV